MFGLGSLFKVACPVLCADDPTLDEESFRPREEGSKEAALTDTVLGIIQKLNPSSANIVDQRSELNSNTSKSGDWVLSGNEKNLYLRLNQDSVDLILSYNLSGKGPISLYKLQASPPSQDGYLDFSEKVPKTHPASKILEEIRARIEGYSQSP